MKSLPLPLPLPLPDLHPLARLRAGNRVLFASALG
jgi:hypothetical protein